MSYFVTGATGFIGRYLVEELLRNRDGDIHVLVRDGSQEKLDKLIAERWDGSDRIKPVTGDLTEPQLGRRRGLDRRRTRARSTTSSTSRRSTT